MIDTSKYWEQLGSESIPDADPVMGGSLRRSKVISGGSSFIEHVFTLPIQGRVLDASCGYGRHLLPFSKRLESVGLDLSPSLLRRCKANLRKNGLKAELVRANIRLLPFAEATFGAVLCMSSLYYLEPRFWPSILSQFAHILTKGGEFHTDVRMRKDVWTPHYGFGIFLIISRIVYELEKNSAFSWLWQKLGFRTLHGLHTFFTTERKFSKILQAAGLHCMKIIPCQRPVFTCRKA